MSCSTFIRCKNVLHSFIPSYFALWWPFSLEIICRKWNYFSRPPSSYSWLVSIDGIWITKHKMHLVNTDHKTVIVDQFQFIGIRLMSSVWSYHNSNKKWKEKRCMSLMPKGEGIRNFHFTLLRPSAVDSEKSWKICANAFSIFIHILVLNDWQGDINICNNECKLQIAHCTPCTCFFLFWKWKKKKKKKNDFINLHRMLMLPVKLRCNFFWWISILGKTKTTKL